jgi:hypothetical protein
VSLLRQEAKKNLLAECKEALYCAWSAIILFPFFVSRDELKENWPYSNRILREVKTGEQYTAETTRARSSHRRLVI